MYETNQITDILTRYINSTDQHIFLTGKAGTGKTTFLQNLALKTHKKMVIAAPTGIAAINAGGVTLHSLFQLPFGGFIPENNEEMQIQGSSIINTPKTLFREQQMSKRKRKVLQNMELLVIDEVSMLRADLLDAIDAVLRRVRKESRYAFGGVQVLFIGDLLQLPPVVKDGEWQVLSNYYASPFFFSAHVLQSSTLRYVELEKIYRQSDARFIDLLNNLRGNSITLGDVQLLNQYYQPNYQQKSDDGVILLTTHNWIADERNTTTLASLKTEERVFRAKVEGDFKEFNFPAEKELHLKEGAQVMFIKNDYSGNQLYFNGKIGFVESIGEDSIQVFFKDGSPSASVERYTWENKKYELNKETNEIEDQVVGKFEQYPLKLAWAITVHKSQGLTFEKAIIDVNRAFAPGQIYVALSRLRSLNGLILTSHIPEHGIPVNPQLTDFGKRKQSQKELLSDLHVATDMYLQTFAMNAYDFSHLMLELRQHLESYDKSENRSEKQQYQAWASKLYDDTLELKDVADTFRNQIHKILYAKGDNYLQTLNERMDKSIGYFEPRLKAQNQSVLDVLDKLTGVKGVKTFCGELEDISAQFCNELQQIYKAQSLLRVTIEGNMLEKEDVKKPDIETPKVSSSSPKGKTKVKKERVSKEKVSKDPSHTVSLALFNEGKSIGEIAKEREYAKPTIESHLARCVEEGLLDIHKVLSKERLEVIGKLIAELGDAQLSPIKERLGDKYSYSDIKMAASYLRRKSGEE
ncbi:MAG: helix-turn-helix domain-containing protein [Mangrovibacterium sp.]